MQMGIFEIGLRVHSPEPDRGSKPTTRLPSRRGKHEGGNQRVKAIRRSPVTRVTSWLLTSAMVAPMALVGHSARAQDQQVLKIVIEDTENRAPGASADLGINTTASLYNEFAASGLGKFNVVSTTEVRNEAVSLGMKVPSNPSAPFN